MATKKITSSDYQIQTGLAGGSNTDINSRALNLSGNTFAIGTLGGNSIDTVYFRDINNNTAAFRWNTTYGNNLGSPLPRFEWSTNSTDWNGILGVNQSGTIVTPWVSGAQSQTATLTFNDLSVAYNLTVIGNAEINQANVLNYNNYLGNPFIKATVPNAIVYANTVDNAGTAGNTFTTSANFTFDGTTLTVPSISTSGGNGNLSVGNITISGKLTQIASNVENYFGGNVVVVGNLRVEGNTTTINANTLTVNDKDIIIANNAAQPSDAQDAGIIINLGNTAGTVNANILYNSVNDSLNINKILIVGNGIATPTNIIANNISANTQIDTYTLKSSVWQYRDGSNLVPGPSELVHFTDAVGNRIAVSSNFTFSNANSTLSVSNVVNIGNAVYVSSNNFIANSQGIFANAHNYANGTTIIREAANATTTIQYNSSGFLRGSNAFVFDDTSNTVTISQSLVANNITSNSATINGNAQISGNLTGIQTLSVQTANVNSGVNVLNGSNINVTGNLFVTRNIFANTSNAVIGNLSSNNYSYSDTGSNLVAGSNTNIQYNLNGRLGGSNAFIFDQSSNTLTVNGAIVADSLVYANGSSVTTQYVTPGQNQNILFNNLGATGAAPTLNYSIGNTTLTSTGNVVVGSKTIGLVANSSAVLSTIAGSSQKDVVANNSFYVAVEQFASPNITISNVTVTGSYANYRFANTSTIPAGANVYVNGNTLAGSYQVNQSGPGYANIYYGFAIPTTNITGTIQLPAYIYTSVNANTWTVAAAGQPGITFTGAARVKYDWVSNTFYTVFATGSTAYAYRSTNGTTWNLKANVSLPTSAATIVDFAYNGAANTFVLAGQDNTSFKIWYAANNDSWAAATATVGTIPQYFNGIATDGANNYAAIDSRNGRWGTTNVASWTQLYTGGPELGAPDYIPIDFNTILQQFIYANNNPGLGNIETFLANSATSTVQYTNTNSVEDIAQSPSQTVALIDSTANTVSYLVSSPTGLANTYTSQISLADDYTSLGFNPQTSTVALANTGPNLFVATLLTAGGGNISAGNVIASALVTSNSLITNQANVNGNVTITGNLAVANVNRVSFGTGNAGQLLQKSINATLEFVDRVVFANLVVGNLTPNTALISTAVNTATGNTFIFTNGSMVFNTETSEYNTQPLYIYLNGSWRQMMISAAL